MSLALAAIQRAFDARVQTLASEPEVAWEGIAYEVQGGRRYITTQMAARSRRPMALNAATPHEWRGVFTLVVKHPASEGLRPAYARAEAVAAHFPRALTLSDGVFRITIQEVGIPPSYSTPGWISQPVQISWQCEEPSS